MKKFGLFASFVLTMPACGGIGLEEFNGETGSLGLEVEPASQVIFPDSPVAFPATQQEVLLKASGDDAIIVTQVFLEGRDAAEFSLPSLPFPRAVQPGTELPLKVGFIPPSVGEFRASLVVIAEEEGIQVFRALLGKGCTDANDDRVCDNGGPPVTDSGDDTGW